MHPDSLMAEPVLTMAVGDNGAWGQGRESRGCLPGRAELLGYPRMEP